jgi:hypothetical protein
MSIRKRQVTIGPTDGAGAFSITVTAPGLVRAVGVVIGTLETPDITITDALTGDGVLAVTGVASDTRYTPKVFAQDTAGANLSTVGDATYESPAIIQSATIVVAGGGATKTGTLYLFLEA